MSKIKQMMVGLGGSGTMRLSGKGWGFAGMRNSPQVYKKLEYLAFLIYLSIYLSIYLCTL